MSWMSEAEYDFMQDCKDKKITAWSAHHTRTHCGKGGRAKFPSDYLTEKERKNLSGECKSYRMNDPMNWEGFLELPDDLKVCYIKALRLKYDIPDSYIAEMLGTTNSCLGKKLTELGLGRSNKRNWKKDEFMVWCNSRRKKHTKVDNLVPTKEANEMIAEAVKNVDVWTTDHSVPRAGRMTFVGNADDILKTLGDILKNEKVRFTVDWHKVDETGVVDLNAETLAKAATTLNYAALNEQRKKAQGTKG